MAREAQAEEKWWERLPNGRAQRRGDKAREAAIALLLKRYFEVGDKVLGISQPNFEVVRTS